MNIASDLEGTLTTGRTWQGIGDYLVQNGHSLKYRLFFLTRLPGLLLARLGLINWPEFGNRWVIDLVRVLKGFDANELNRMADWVIEHEMWPKRREVVLAEITHHCQAGHRVILASGTYQPIAEAFARQIGVTAVIGSPLQMVNDRATGSLAGPLNVKTIKAQRIRAFLAGEALNMAYGDTAFDVPMLMMSNTPIAVWPDAKLRQIALSSGWRILSA